MISSQQLGERLTNARKRAKLTQADVADGVGLARTTLVAIEEGERMPSNAEILRLAEVLKTSVHDLLRETLVLPEIHPEALARHRAQPPLPSVPRRKLPERYVALAVAAYDRELLSEGELAEYLDTDIADARRIYQEHLKVHLDDETQLPIDFAAGAPRTE